MLADGGDSASSIVQEKSGQVVVKNLEDMSNIETFDFVPMMGVSTHHSAFPLSVMARSPSSAPD